MFVGVVDFGEDHRVGFARDLELGGQAVTHADGAVRDARSEDLPAEAAFPLNCGAVFSDGGGGLERDGAGGG